MAAPMATHVRIKVFFENNEFDASWLLIDTSDLRTMKDVQRYISLKFFGKNIPLYLSLQGCFLPDWEKSVILRDNDCVNAKCIHNDSFETGTLLLTSAVEDENTDLIKVSKKKKKKDKYENEKAEKQVSMEMKSLQQDCWTELNAQNEFVAMETSPSKHKNKKKKHSVDYESESESSKHKKKKRKRKNENDENEKNDEPIYKKLAVIEPVIDSAKKSKLKDASSSCDSKSSIYEKINEDNQHCSTVPQSQSLADESVDRTLEISPGQENQLNDSRQDTTEEGKKRKRKRVRKRKRKNESESLTSQSFSETANFKTPVNNSWNWGSGKYVDVEPPTYKPDNVKHKVFQSDSNESDGDVPNDSIKSSSAMYNYENEKTAMQTEFDTNNSFSKSAVVPQEESQPSVLATSYLSNGVAVYSRNRGKQKQNIKQYAELTKEQQLNTKLTNVSVVLQNPSNMPVGDTINVDKDIEREIAAIYEAVPIDKNYSKFPALVGPPRVGDRLVYKVIELSETYTPEVSDYKEAVVSGYNPQTQIVELENKCEIKKKRSDGKFEVDFEDNEDDSQQTELKVCLPLDSLLEPKLLS